MYHIRATVERFPSPGGGMYYSILSIEREIFRRSEETEPTANDNQGQKFAFYSAPGSSDERK